MAKTASSSKRRPVPSSTTESRSVRKSGQQSGYDEILSGMKQLIADSRYRAAATVNRELVGLYWNIGRVIVRQQETANWGDAVVERLAKDLRTAFPEMKGLSQPNIWKMRQFFESCREVDGWLNARSDTGRLASALREMEAANVATAPPPTGGHADNSKLSTVSRVLGDADLAGSILSTLSRELRSGDLRTAITSISWSQHVEILSATTDPASRYFYMQMSVRERWSVRELRRQIDAALYQRYMESKRHPEKYLPVDAECGDLLPFKDHYVLEFLGLEDEHSEKQLRKAILGNLRDFFLEFGKDLTFVGEEYPITIGGETFYIDLLFYHRRLQCLVAVDLKKGRFKPEYVGKSQFYVAALDEHVRLPHENPSVGLILCRDANHVHVKLALSTAAKKVGIATYQTALPAEHDIQRRLAQLPAFDDPSDE